MKKRTFAWEIRTLIAQFADAFNDIIINRYNIDQEIQDRIHVTYRYAPKQRVMTDLINKDQHFRLPIVAISISSIRRDVDRVFNKIDGSYYNLTPAASGVDHLLQPVPVKIGINLSILTRYQADMDQIITNWAPYCDPYIAICWTVPELGHEIRNIVHWDGNIRLNYPTDLNNTQPWRVIADTTFDIDGWLFKYPANQVGKIYTIETTFTAVSDISDNFNYMQLFEDIPYSTDWFEISARPQLEMALPYKVAVSASNYGVTIYGDMFQYLSGVYLSASPGVYLDSDLSFFNFYSANDKLSAANPGFSGVEISTWNRMSNNAFSFYVPSAVAAGFIDVIARNEAGYGKLTVDSRRTTLNPYPSTLPEYYTYVEYQHPCVSGIEIVGF